MSDISTPMTGPVNDTGAPVTAPTMLDEFGRMVGELERNWEDTEWPPPEDVDVPPIEPYESTRLLDDLADLADFAESVGLFRDRLSQLPPISFREAIEEWAGELAGVLTQYADDAA